MPKSETEHRGLDGEVEPWGIAPSSFSLQDKAVWFAAGGSSSCWSLGAEMLTSTCSPPSVQVPLSLFAMTQNQTAPAPEGEECGTPHPATRALKGGLHYLCRESFPNLMTLFALLQSSSAVISLPDTLPSRCHILHICNEEKKANSQLCQLNCPL